MSRGPGGDADRLIRDRLLCELWDSDRTYWTRVRWAAVAGLTRSTVRRIIRDYQAGGDVDRAPRDLAVTDHDRRRQMLRDRLARRRARHEAEVARYVDDPRVKRLRELTRRLPAGPQDAVLQAEQSELVAALWADDPQFWTIERLTVAMGRRSTSGVPAILKRAQQQDQAPRMLGVLRQGRSHRDRRRGGRAA